MLLSYLQAVQTLVAPSIYNRGLRFYLEGRVGSYREMDLDFWREYKLLDQETYLVRLPQLHLALSRHKWDKATEVLKQHASCECEYFREFQVCKHIVAVCAALEQEAGPKTQTKIPQTEVDSLLDKVFAVEMDRKSRVWAEKSDNFFARPNMDTRGWLEDMAHTVAKNPTLYSELFTHLRNLAVAAQRDYEQEKRLSGFISEILRSGFSIWWQFWQDTLGSLEPTYLKEILLDLWRRYQAGVQLEFLDQFQAYLQKLPTNDKHWILDKLRQHYDTERRVWVEFVFAAQMYDWLLGNLSDLDPNTLVRAALLMPEQREDIEQRLLHQVKIWVDFLQSGDYDPLVQVFHAWRDRLGQSTFYDEAVKYARLIHPKKKKLLRQIAS